MKRQVDAEVLAVDAPEEAARGADIVLLATNALAPFFPADWIRDGMHIATVRSSEMTVDCTASLRPGSGIEPRGGAAGDARRGGKRIFRSRGQGDYRREELQGTEAGLEREAGTG